MLLSGGLNEAGEEVFSSDVIFETRSPVNAYFRWLLSTRVSNLLFVHRDDHYPQTK